jgi:hypothetical protein
MNSCVYSECNNKATFLCSKCQKVYYCSRTCQKNHWLHHKKDCNEESKSKLYFIAISEDQVKEFSQHFKVAYTITKDGTKYLPCKKTVSGCVPMDQLDIVEQTIDNFLH